MMENKMRIRIRIEYKMNESDIYVSELNIIQK